MFGLGFQEVLIIGAVAVMLFGKRLPEVAKSLGGQYRELRKGLSEIQSQMDFTDTVYDRRPGSINSTASPVEDFDDYDEPTAPKLELPNADRNEESTS